MSSDWIEFLQVLSEIAGWGYFIAWTVSFIPQIFMNWYRKSVTGLSFDYICYNFLGFTCYSVYNCAFYWNATVQQQYFSRNPGVDSIPVAANDVAFALFAVTATLINIVQCFIYKKGPENKNSIICMLFAGFGWVSAYVMLMLAIFNVVETIVFLYYLSYIKLGVTLVKYIPQAWLNYQKQSTIGWSIWNIVLDFTGGSLSLTQQGLQCVIQNDWAPLTGNIAKLGLSIFSICFDTLFMIQHWVLYKDNRESKTAKEGMKETVEYLKSLKAKFFGPKQMEIDVESNAVSPVSTEKMEKTKGAEEQVEDSESEVVDRPARSDDNSLLSIS